MTGWQNPYWYIAVIGDPVTLGTAHLPNITANFQGILATRFAMQAVNVLGDESEVWSVLLHLDERVVGGVGGDWHTQLTAPVIPIPDKACIRCECFWSSQLFRTEIPPQPVRAAERRFQRRSLHR